MIKTSIKYLCALLLIVNVAFAKNEHTIEFFVSNNTDLIEMPLAFKRLTGKEQDDLRIKVMRVLQNNHLEPKNLIDILGVYDSVYQKMTAENAEFIQLSIFPQSDEKIFIIAQQLAVALHQESVAVFIPMNGSVTDIKVDFLSQHGIRDTVNELHKKLPKIYSQAFSLHLKNKQKGFNRAIVTEIEWLGSRININDIKKAFPCEKINGSEGNAFLVYQNGKRQRM